MKKKLIGALTLLLLSCYANSQIVVKMVLPNNCEENSTEVENIKIEEGSELVLFPNPNSGNFSLYANFTENIKKATIQIYNASGTLLYTEEVFCDSPNLVKQLSLTHLSSGSYIVRFRTQKRVISKKLLIN